ncbi:MAG: DUF1214 domain-containing protein [Novosphingobium sp.]|jgi:hypothetical protein|nr:DUF1214 domain-containing protein [Novosphingobium sp.]
MSADRTGSRWVTAGVAVAGLLAGAASGWFWLQKGMIQGESYAGWSGSSVTGSADADPWTRARVAVAGLLALTREHAIYFTRNTDGSGARLREGCRYRVSGEAMPAQWWSVTVYAADNYLPLNDDDALSFDATEVQPDAAGQWSAILSSTRPASGAWASTRQAGNYDITLRLYQPALQAQTNYGSIPMPRVEKLDCGGQA